MWQNSKRNTPPPEDDGWVVIAERLNRAAARVMDHDRRLLELGPSERAVAHRHTGKEHDAETALESFGARQLNALPGRFTTSDSATADTADSPQSWNKYSYSLNDPITLLDANGHWPTSIHNQVIEQAFKKWFPHA